METYYIYCSNNQAYYALINNSIVAKSLMREDFKGNTAAYYSADCVFVTKERLPETVRKEGVSDAFYPVTLGIEVDAEHNRIPALLVTLSDDGAVDVTERRDLSEYGCTENCIGAFVFGEIPISYLCSIVFDNEDDKTNFNKSSDDLWFPEELKTVWQPGETADRINVDVLKRAAEKADAALNAQDRAGIEKAVLRRNRAKAAAYFAITATEGWLTEAADGGIASLRSNVDAELIKRLDKDEKLLGLTKKSYDALKAKTISLDRFLKSEDRMLEGGCESVDQKMFSIIVGSLFEQKKLDGEVSDELLQKIANECRACGTEEEKQTIAAALQAVGDYANLNTDPDKALERMGSFRVLKAFAILLYREKGDALLQLSVAKLDQYEKRYAYIMFGLLHGMFEVERTQKSNRALECRIEEIVLSRYQDERLINTAHLGKTAFLAGWEEPDGSCFGLTPTMEAYYSCESARELLLRNPARWEELYQKLKDAIQKEAFFKQKGYLFDPPIEIVIRQGGNTILSASLQYESDEKGIKKSIKEIESAIRKKAKTRFNAEDFQKRILDTDSSFRKLFKSEKRIIQKVCADIAEKRDQ